MNVKLVCAQYDYIYCVGCENMSYRFRAGWMAEPLFGNNMHADVYYQLSYALYIL